MLKDALKEQKRAFEKVREGLQNELLASNQTKDQLESKLLAEQRKLQDLFIDAENLRAELHKEVKDYRRMKRKLKGIIVQF